MLPTNSDDRLTLLIAGLSAGISLLTAAITFWQLRTSVRQSKHAATFEHLRKSRELQRKVFRNNPLTARSEALAFFANRSVEPSDNTRDYLELLDNWDLLGVAFRHRLVNRKIVLASLRNTLRNSHGVSLEFIDELRTNCGVPTIYYGLYYLIRRCKRRTPREFIADQRTAMAEWRIFNLFTSNKESANVTIRSGDGDPVSSGTETGSASGHPDVAQYTATPAPTIDPAEVTNAQTGIDPTAYTGKEAAALSSVVGSVNVAVEQPSHEAPDNPTQPAGVDSGDRSEIPVLKIVQEPHPK